MGGLASFSSPAIANDVVYVGSGDGHLYAFTNGQMPYIDFVVTAKEIGSNKPEPYIFLAALKRAGVSASEAIYIGDQYETDVVGAKGAGIKPILIDRYDLSLEVGDCPRIHSLIEVAQYL